MFLFPGSPQDDPLWHYLPPKDQQGQHNFSVVQGEGADRLRSLNVPFCINIMAGGRYRAGQIVSLTSLSGKEHFHVEKNSAGEATAPQERTELHQHDYFELMYVMEGAVEQHIEDGVFQYGKGTACLLNRNTRHFEVLSDNYLLVFLCLSRDYIRRSITQNAPPEDIQTAVYRFFAGNLEGQAQYRKDYLVFSPVPTADGPNRVDGLVEALAGELMLKQPGHSHMVVGLLARLLAFFQDEGYYQCRHVKLDSSVEAYVFNKVTGYMEESNTRVSRAALADRLRYSSDYINRIVKKHSGMSISEYNQTILIKKAERMLVETEDSISSIITTLGFENKTYFYKLFDKKHGTTPLSYRRRHRGQ